MAESFSTRLRARQKQCGGPLCLGIDPRPDRLPADCWPNHRDSLEAVAEATLRYGRALLEAAGPYAAAVKPQSAFFECLGPAGVEVFWTLCEEARKAGLLIVADVKRGDIGSTAEAYAQAYLAPTRAKDPVADAVTLNPYLGSDSLHPFCKLAVGSGGGLFVLVKTSNPSSVELQELVADGISIHSHVGRLIEGLNQEYAPGSDYGPVGAVVGATWPEDLRKARAAMPHTLFLVPGVGAQGGSIQDILPAFDTEGFGALIPVSRSLNFPWGSGEAPSNWRQMIEESARTFGSELAVAIEHHVHSR